jgi:hypothetical protein
MSLNGIIGITERAEKYFESSKVIRKAKDRKLKDHYEDLVYTIKYDTEDLIKKIQDETGLSVPETNPVIDESDLDSETDDSDSDEELIDDEAEEAGDEESEDNEHSDDDDFERVP